MPDTNLDKLKSLLAELFMLDQADLDFGIYRVMNAKRAEVTRFGAGIKLRTIWRCVRHRCGTVTLTAR